MTEIIKDICELNTEEMAELMKGLNEPAFRARQVYDWLHKHKVKSFEEMRNIPSALKAKLSENYRVCVMEPVDILVSRLDGTRKYVFALYDDNVIEAVLMRYKHGNSVCISSQVGCRMGCRFCVRGSMPLKKSTQKRGRAAKSSLSLRCMRLSSCS